MSNNNGFSSTFDMMTTWREVEREELGIVDGHYSPSTVASIVYSLASAIIFLLVCFYGWKRMKLTQDEEGEKLSGCRKYLKWASIVWKMKSIYLSAVIHIYDIATDVGIIVLWAEQSIKERNGDPMKDNVREINMTGMFVTALIAFFLYRFISAYFVWEFTGKFGRAFVQFWDLEIYRAIYITHQLQREEAGNLQRWLQKFEAIFESAPQSLLQLVYITKTADYSLLILSSIVLSFVSVAARFTSDDKIFFSKEAEQLGLKYNKRRKYRGEIKYGKEYLSQKGKGKKHNKVYALEIHHDANQQKTAITKNNNNNNNKTNTRSSSMPNVSSVKSVKSDSDSDDGGEIEEKANGNDVGRLSAVKSSPAVINDNDNDNDEDKKYIDDEDDDDDEDEDDKDEDEDEDIDLDEIIDTFKRWQIWKYLSVNTAYLFRYSFRMCDVFSRLIIFSLVWCTLSGTVTAAIIIFEMITVVSYATYIGKYNIFQLVVATYFSEDNKGATVNYCFFRRIESLIYLVIVTIVILFDPKYTNDSDIDCYKDYCSEDEWNKYYSAPYRIEEKGEFYSWDKYGKYECSTKRSWGQLHSDAQIICDWNVYDRNICDCTLNLEVLATKCLLILGWTFANLSSDVFFGAFHAMRAKFGTNERDIVNVMEKRDWEAFSEMLNFGYRMNRFDNRTKRSALTIYLDRVFPDKFIPSEVDQMIVLGANINDKSKYPKDENDEDLPDQIGDGVLIKYVKVTPVKNINRDFDQVVQKWTTTGVEGGDYPQDIDRISVDINDTNKLGYTAFAIYWEKVQYERYKRRQKKEHIDIEQYWRSLEYNDSEPFHENKEELRPFERKKENAKYYFKQFYRYIDEWEELGADMSTESEDRVTPLLAYVMDTDIKDIDMKCIERYCPKKIDIKSRTKDKDIKKKKKKKKKNKKGKGKDIEIKYDDDDDDDNNNNKKNEEDPFAVDIEVREKAFSIWFDNHGYDDPFDCKQILKWYELGCCGHIKSFELLKRYIKDRKPEEQSKEDIDILMKVGCNFGDYEKKRYPSKKSASINNMMDNIFEYSSQDLNLDIMQYLVDQYGLAVEINDKKEDFDDVYDKKKYETQLQKYLVGNDFVTVDKLERLIKMGYILDREESIKSVIKASTNRKIPFEVFKYLLDIAQSKDDKPLSYRIFDNFVERNEEIKYDQIKLLIEEYGFSPYASVSGDCAIHYIWKNYYCPLSVALQFWAEYGAIKFEPFEGVYEGYLWRILQYRDLTIDDAELIIKNWDPQTKNEKECGILHHYVLNSHIKLDVLKWFCQNLKDGVKHKNRAGSNVLHYLCQNSQCKIEMIEYLVHEHKFKMMEKNHRGHRPLHYICDTDSARWSKDDVKKMLLDLNCDFTVRRYGEICLLLISHKNNFCTEALIYLYTFYKDKVDLNELKSTKTMWTDNAQSGGVTILMNIVERGGITPNQLKRFVEIAGLDIVAVDNNRASILHYMRQIISAEHLKMVEELTKNDDQFAVDLPNASGQTPFQKWLSYNSSQLHYKMDIIKAWEDIGVDTTQVDTGSTSNMLHYYLSRGQQWDMRLADIRKMCSDDYNPWKLLEKTDPRKLKQTQQEREKEESEKKRKSKYDKFKIPLHMKPVPSGQTLFDYLFSKDGAINLNIVSYFKKKVDAKEIRLETNEKSPLIRYISYVNRPRVHVLKYLVDKLKCDIKPKEQYNLAFMYFSRSKEKLDFNVLDWMYQNKVDFKEKKEEFKTLLHSYCTYVYFRPSEFIKFIKRYGIENHDVDKEQDNPTCAVGFYERRRAELTSQIITTFTKLGYDINENINGQTPLQHYCNVQNSHYALRSIIRSFMTNGSDINTLVGGRKGVSLLNFIANGDGDYEKLPMLEKMINEFGLKLKCPKKKKGDIFLRFLERKVESTYAYSNVFDQFKVLLNLFIKFDVEPIHILHSKDDEKDDKNMRVQYKLYRVDDSIERDKHKLADKKHKDYIKLAKEYVGRVMVVSDQRPQLLRDCRVLDPRNYRDWQRKKIPSAWLVPINWEYLKENAAKMGQTAENFKAAKKLAELSQFIDIDIIKQIKEKWNDLTEIRLSQQDSLLFKYIRYNHRTQLTVQCIEEMKELGIDFNHYNESGYSAIGLMVQKSKGILRKDIIEALVKCGCPINWKFKTKEDDDEEEKKDADNDNDDDDYIKLNDDDDDDDDNFIKADYTPLHYYCMLPEANVDGFKILIEAGADVKIKSRDDITSTYYLIKNCENLDTQFIKYLVNECNVNLNQQLPAYKGDDCEDLNMFNVYLRINENVKRDSVRDLIQIANCDPNCREEETGENTIHAYLHNNNAAGFDINVIIQLIELGANINEKDNENDYPIQHLLHLQYIPLTILIQHLITLIEYGAKLKHILPDIHDIENHKLYILQNLGWGYAPYNGYWATLKITVWTQYSKKRKIRRAVVLDETGSRNEISIWITKNNLQVIDTDILFEKFPALKNAKPRADIAALAGDEEESDDSEDEEEEEEQKEYVSPLKKTTTTTITTTTEQKIEEEPEIETIENTDNDYTENKKEEKEEEIKSIENKETEMTVLVVNENDDNNEEAP